MPDHLILNAGDSQNAALRRAGEVLESGGVVLVPTDTVYGAAVRIDSPQGVDRLRALSGDASSPLRPLVPHVATAHEASGLLGPGNRFRDRLFRKLWPGPIGMVIDVDPARQSEIAATMSISTGDLFADNTITLRCPDEPVFADLAARVGGVLAVAKFRDVGNTVPRDIADHAGGLDLILDNGPTRYNKLSTLIRVRDDDYEVTRAGVYDARIVRRMLRTSVLFVCSGNTCRSPMAEALGRKAIADSLGVRENELDKKGYGVASAGVFALAGTRATPQAVEAVATLGGDLARHRSQPLTLELIHHADVVYAMGAGHARAVEALVPSARGKVKLLDPGGDIEDPIGSDLSIYKNLAARMQTLIRDRLADDHIG